jgi:hypothetical protein
VCETGSFGKVGYNLTTLHTSIVILINEERLNDNENFVNVRTDKIVELVENTINDLHKKVALLILESTLHKQGKDLVKERTSTKFASLVSDLAEGSLSYRRSTILYLQK